jgi:hypothetical protein
MPAGDLAAVATVSFATIAARPQPA